MSRKSTSIIAISIFFLLAVFSLGVPKTALADFDNDNPSLGSCDITVGSTQVLPGSKMLVYPTTINGKNLKFDIKVCGGPTFSQQVGDQWGSPNTCLKPQFGRNLIASVRVPDGLKNWTQFILSPAGSSGCYTGTLELKSDSSAFIDKPLDIELDFESNNGCQSGMPVCKRVNPLFAKVLQPADDEPSECEAKMAAIRSCSFLQWSPATIFSKSVVTFSGDIPDVSSCSFLNATGGGLFQVWHNGPPQSALGESESINKSGPFQVTRTPLSIGKYTVQITAFISQGYPVTCTKQFNVCVDDEPGCSSVVQPTPSAPSIQFDLCKQAGSEEQFLKCSSCLGTEGDVKGIWTAVGCIKTEPQAIIQTVVRIGISIGGGIALLMTLVGGFMLTTSQGDPKRVQEGKEMITSSVIGIIFVLFSVVILQFIGVTILRLPGFGT